MVDFSTELWYNVNYKNTLCTSFNCVLVQKYAIIRNMNMPFKFQPFREIEDAEIISKTPNLSHEIPTSANDAINKETMPEPETTKSDGARDHSGNGHKAGAELTQLIKKTLEENKIKDRQLETELKKDEKLFDKEVERMEDVYAQFSDDIDTLKKRLDGETDRKRKKRLQVLMTQAKDHLRVLRNFFPKDEPGATAEYDTEVFRSVAEKFKKYEGARRRQTIAEIALNKKGGSIQKHEEARNEAIQLRDEISSMIKQGESVIAQKGQHPAENESVSLTHKEVLAQRKEWLEHHKKSQEESVLEAVPAEEPAEIETTSAEMAPAQLEQPSEKTGEQLTRLDIENMQTEAYENFGEKHTPEEHDAILPILTEEVSETVGVPQEGQDATFEKFESLVEINELTKEQALDGVAIAEKAVLSHAENVGALGYIHKMGDAWNKIPLRYKLLLSTGMLASGIGAVAVGSIAAAGTITALGAGIRGVSGAGMFVGFEKMLKGSAEKKGGMRSETTELRHTVLAASLSILIAGVLPGVVRDYAVEHGFFDKVRDFFGGHTAHAEAGSAASVAQITNEYVATAEAGDSRWSLAERALAEGPYKDQFNSIASAEQRTYIIDALKDKLTEGMTPEQANSLNIGDEINFKEHFADTDFMKETFSDAQNLSPEEIANIHNYENTAVAEIATETPERMVSASQLLGQPLITDFAPPQTASTGAIPQEVTPDADKDIVMGGSKVPTMPQEILPSDPRVLAYADQQVHTHITTLFGSKGFLGIGAVDGMKTANWLDFANRPVEEVMGAKPNVFPESGEVRTGMENNEALGKMKEYLKAAFEGTNVQPEPGETVEKYLKRAAAMAIGNFMNKG